MPNLPSGTVTFVFSDIEGSTQLLKQLGDARYTELLATHRRLVREAFAAHNGHEIDTQGDAFFYSFTRAREAVTGAVALQRAHHDQDWPEGTTVRLRLGLHTGEPAVGDEGYTGLDVVRASRIAAVARGGQVLLSDSTRALVADDLPDGVTLRPLGERQLRGLDRAEPLHELVIPGIDVTPERTSALQRAAPPEPPEVIEPTRPPGGTTDERWAMGFAHEALAGMPDWVRRTAVRAIGPPLNRTTQLIEERVLAELAQELEEELAEEDELDEDAGPGADRSRALNRRRITRSSRERRAGRLPPPKPGSLADEILQLQRLRDSGALSEAQYAKAVDRLVEGDG